MQSAEDFTAKLVLAWKGDLSFSDLVTTAGEVDAQGTPELAVVLYQTWLSRTPSVYAHAAHFNLGATLSTLGDLLGAEAAYRRALAMAPDFAHPRLNLGLLHERNGKVEDALTEWQWMVRHCARDENGQALVVAALNHLGRLLENQKRYLEAVEFLNQSLQLNPQQPDVLHHWVFLRQKLCAWPVYQPVPGVSEDAMREATSALAMLSLTDDPQEQLNAARRFVEKKMAPAPVPLTQGSAYGHKKLRIAYCSSDFCMHPVSMLTVQLFELHNRDAFEVYGYCWSPDDGSATRKRVLAAMDHFHSIHQLSDAAAAALIRSHEIDILVDLQGQTAGARADLLAYRPAPIQITYLGLPATTGLPCIDYVIADEFLIPKEQARFYSEKPLYMPHIYQVSDRLRPEAPAPSRASCGLPEDAVVLCSFNNSYKYTAPIFNAWANILRRVPGSVLWLLADNPWAEANLRKEAAARDIDPQRLIFAGRVSPENYLARYRVADVFLDSFSFNAGTTANDCLWMGCPLVTLSGRSFASRMAGALLTAAGLPELITYNVQDYEDCAVAVASDAPRRQQLRAQLQQVRDSGALFDTPQFTRDLEQRLQSLVAALPQPA